MPLCSSGAASVLQRQVFCRVLLPEDPEEKESLLGLFSDVLLVFQDGSSEICVPRILESEALYASTPFLYGLPPPEISPRLLLSVGSSVNLMITLSAWVGVQSEDVQGGAKQQRTDVVLLSGVL